MGTWVRMVDKRYGRAYAKTWRAIGLRFVWNMVQEAILRQTNCCRVSIGMDAKLGMVCYVSLIMPRSLIAFRTAVSLAEFEAAEMKASTTCKHCKRTGHNPDIYWENHPKTRPKTIFIKQQHLESATEMSSRFKEYVKRTRDTEEAKLAKIRPSQGR